MPYSISQSTSNHKSLFALSVEFSGVGFDSLLDNRVTVLEGKFKHCLTSELCPPNLIQASAVETTTFSFLLRSQSLCRTPTWATVQWFPMATASATTSTMTSSSSASPPTSPAKKRAPSGLLTASRRAWRTSGACSGSKIKTRSEVVQV